MAKRNERRSDCPISCSLDVFGDKWSLLVVRNMMFYNINTYGEFLTAPENIATNILADRLATLENAGIVSKHVHTESRAKIFYKLTSKGIDLLPLMIELTLWGDRYFEVAPEAKAMVKSIKADKAKFIKEASVRLRKI